jgi:hypothetical protein
MSIKTWYSALKMSLWKTPQSGEVQQQIKDYSVGIDEFEAIEMEANGLMLYYK